MKKIAVIGAESTGKSVLCRSLASHYGVFWCPEYARQYLLQYGREYTFNDLKCIAKGQLALEDQFIQRSLNENKKMLFIDTEMYIMKVWYEYAYNRCPYYILEEIVNRTYDLYLLTDIDLPWEKDQLREYPDSESRRQLFHTYRDCLINQNTDWHLVSGQGAERIKNAIAILEHAFSCK